jgi:hypothetical protein
MDFIAWLQALPLSEWVQTSDYGFPLLLAAHSIGLAAVVGVLIVLDLRVLGFAEGIPIAALSRLMPVAWWGFAINAASGAMLFMANATRLITNWAFILKMCAVVLGGIVSALLWRSLTSHPVGASPAGSAGVAPSAFIVTRNGRIIAVVSLVLWFGAILFGRVIAYVMDRAILHGGF